MIDLSIYKMRETSTAIYFWGGPLSQWFKAPFRQRFIPSGHLYDFNCAEQYMMGAKALLFNDAQSLNKILASRDPKEQKALGRLVKNFEPAKWTEAVPDVLIHGNMGKHSSNEDLRHYLGSTGTKRLVEGSPVDRIYGVGLRYDDPKIEDETNWLGQNLLGNALEIVRKRLFK